MFQKITRIYELMEGELKTVAPKTRIMEELLAISVNDKMQLNLRPKVEVNNTELNLCGFNIVAKALATGGDVEEVMLPLKPSIVLGTRNLGDENFVENTDDVSLTQINDFVDELKGVIEFHK